MALVQSIISRARRAAHDERGFTIIEVLVSALLLATISVGLFVAFDGATKASGTNRARSQAAQIAQADQERLRSMTGSQLAALNGNPSTTTKSVDGRTYTITSSALWTNDPTGTASCGGLGKEPGYQRITSVVSWPDRGALLPVQADSLKAVPNGGYSTTRGSLAVKLTDRNGAGTAGIPVSISGPSSATATTSSAGCALFGFVPIGTYTVTIGSGTTYVRDQLPNEFVVTRSSQVIGEQTSTVSVNYDRAASLGVAFYTHALTGATDGTSGDSTTTGDSFSVASSGLGSPYFRGFGLLSTASATAFTYGTTGAIAASASAQKVLYPFTSYRVWAGSCQVNDPTQAPTSLAADPNQAVSVVQGGATAASKVLEPTLKVKTKTSESAYFLITPSNAGCTAPIASGSTAATSFSSSLPFGSYTVCAQDRPIGQTSPAPTKAVTQTSVVNTIDPVRRTGTDLTMTGSMAAISPTNTACR